MRPLGHAIRGVGRAVDRVGMMFQGREAVVEKLVPSTRVVPVAAKELQYGLRAFVASSAAVVGDVSLGELSSVWYGTTIRAGKENRVTIGKNSAIQDCATVMASKKGISVVIGDDVTIAPGAYLDSCTVEDGAMIGMGARVLAGARVGKDAFVDAGAVVPPGTTVPSGELWTGNPARPLRSLTVDEMAYLRATAATNAELSQRHFEQTEKTAAEVEEQFEEAHYRAANGIAPEETLETPDADVVQYYKLSEPAPDTGIFRTHEYDDDAADELRAKEEIEADEAEEEYYRHLATLNRVGEGIKFLLDARVDRPELRDTLLERLRDRDARSADYLTDLLRRAATAKEEDVPALEEELKSLDAWKGARKGYSAAAERKALAAHGQALFLASGKDASARA